MLYWLQQKPPRFALLPQEDPMRFANLMFATILLSAVAGAAVAQSEHRTGSVPAASGDNLTTSLTWLWQPPMRRIASAR